MKISQLFFTTNPTVEGTGLGLSLNYDINKSHEEILIIPRIKVNPKECEETMFVAQIPF